MNVTAGGGRYRLHNDAAVRKAENGSKGDVKMELNVFKDTLFDLINESPDLDLYEIAWNEKQNLIVAKMNDGSSFAVQVKPAAELSDEERSGLVSLGTMMDDYAEKLGRHVREEADAAFARGELTIPPELDESIRRMIEEA